MRNPQILPLLAVLLILGLVPIPIRSQTSYPAEVKDFSEISKFPAEVSGYLRGEVIAYAPGLSSFSIAYDRYDEQLQNAVTLYFGPQLKDTSAQILNEKTAIINAHPDSRIVAEKVLKLSKNGRTYKATLVTFEYTETFAGRSQKLMSFLLITFTSQWRVKVRSTTPISQGAIAESNLIPFLEGVSWAE